MKKIKEFTAKIIMLFALALSCQAIEGLKISLDATNAVLRWPSETNETYIIQYRPHLTEPWTNLATASPATLTTNITSFVHSNSVVVPSVPPGGTNGPGSPPPPAPAPPIVPGNQASAQSVTNDGFGFYRVVRTGPHFYGVKNGSVLSGKLTLPVEIGVTSVEQLRGLQIYTGTDPDVPIPIQGIDFIEESGLLPTATWDTRFTPNGTYPVHFKVSVMSGNETVIVDSASFSVTISNQVWFPDAWNVAGYYFPLSAQSVHTNGTWQMDFYKSPIATGTTNFVAHLSGSIDTNGFLTYQGYPAVFLNLTDQSGHQLSNKWYEVVIFTQAAGATPSGGPATTNRIPVETAWPTNGYLTQFGICYMPVFGDPANGGVSASTLQNHMQLIYGYAKTRSLGVHTASGDGTLPITMVNQTSFNIFLTSVLRAEPVRNFYYFGHGGPDGFGQGPANGQTTISDLNFVLRNNFADPMNGTNGAPFPHPFRFVFLDGCKTADGDLCKAFGIPKIKNMSTNDFINRGMRYRAFMGWNGLLTTGFADHIDNQYITFMESFWEGWVEQGLTLRQAHTRASTNNGQLSAPYPWAKFLVIYGYEGLKWVDTDP